MKEIGLRVCYRKRRTRTTRDSDFSSGLKNILNRDFQPQRSDAAWCTDITYIWTGGGFVYLVSIMDLYLRKIISWTLGKMLLREREELHDLLEGIMGWIQEFREEMLAELDDLKDMIAENSGIGFH